MTLWTMIAVIVVVGVLGDVLKQRYKSKGTSQETAEVIQDHTRKLEIEMEALRKRVRNLETIAATAPDEFRSGGMSAENDVDLDADNDDEFNERLVNQLAKRKRTR
jgi:hypothetical protein